MLVAFAILFLHWGSSWDQILYFENSRKYNQNKSWRNKRWSLILSIYFSSFSQSKMVYKGKNSCNSWTIVTKLIQMIFLNHCNYKVLCFAFVISIKVLEICSTNEHSLSWILKNEPWFKNENVMSCRSLNPKHQQTSYGSHVNKGLGHHT